MAVVIMIIWFAIGIYGIKNEEKFGPLNVPLIIYFGAVLIFPWIFHWCGLF